MLVSILMVDQKDRVNIFGKINHIIKENLKMDLDMGKDCGLVRKEIMEILLMEIMLMIKDVGRALFNGRMEAITRGNIIMI